MGGTTKSIVDFTNNPTGKHTTSRATSTGTLTNSPKSQTLENSDSGEIANMNANSGVMDATETASVRDKVQIRAWRRCGKGFGDLCDGLMIEFGRWDFGRLVKWGLRESLCQYWVLVGFGGQLMNYLELQEELMMMVLLMGLMSNGDDSDKKETLTEQRHGVVTNTMCNVDYIESTGNVDYIESTSDRESSSRSMDHLAIRGVASSCDHFMKISPVHNSSTRDHTSCRLGRSGEGHTMGRRDVALAELKSGGIRDATSHSCTSHTCMILSSPALQVTSHHF
ncbi:hypothetical protein AKJ16_DCAP22970 [Drosera capensis]